MNHPANDRFWPIREAQHGYLSGSYWGKMTLKSSVRGAENDLTRHLHSKRWDF